MDKATARSGSWVAKPSAVLAGVSVGLLVLHILPLIFPGGRFWGFNHFQYIPGGLTAAFLLTAGLALAAAFMPGAAELGERWAAIFDDLFFASSFRLLNRAAVTAVAVFFFLIFSCPTHFLGDGYGYLEIFNRGLADFESGGMGAALLISGLQKVIGGENSALGAFRALSIISGALYIWLLFAMAGNAVSSPVKRLLIVAGGLCSGVILLFFGYVEFYPGIWPIFFAVLYFGLKSPYEGKNIAWAWGLTALGIFYHLQMLILVPAVVYLTFSDGIGARLFRRFRIYIWLLAAAAGVVLAILIFNRIRDDIAFENLFLPLFKGKPIDPDYAVVSLKHLLDIFNLLMLVVPSIFLLLPLTGRGKKQDSLSRSRVFLLLTGLAGLAFVFFIDPQLGMARDWDLFSLPVWVFIMMAILYITDEAAPTLKRFLPVLIIFPAMFTMPYLITNMSQRASLQYAESAVRLDPAKTFGAFSVLKEMAEKERDVNRFDSLKAIYERNYPVSRYNQVMEKLDANDFEEAMRLFASLPANRFDGDWQRIRSRYYYLRGEFAKAMEHIDYAIRLRPQEAEYYWQRGMIYFSMGKFELSLTDMGRAYGRDPKNLRILDALAYMFSQAGQPDSTVYYGEKLVGLDSTAMGGYYLLAKAYDRLSRADKAAFHARQFLKLTSHDTAYGEQRHEMETLTGQNTPGVDTR